MRLACVLERGSCSKAESFRVSVGVGTLALVLDEEMRMRGMEAAVEGMGAAGTGVNADVGETGIRLLLPPMGRNSEEGDSGLVGGVLGGAQEARA